MTTVVFTDRTREIFAVVYPVDGWVMCFEDDHSPAVKWIPAWRISELLP